MLHSELFTDDKVDLKVLKERALGMRWAGMPEGTIPLTSADPDFKPAIEIREAMTDFIKGGYFPYAPDALPGLREAISGSLKMRKNEDVPPEFIQPVDSASACMHAIALSVLKPGDEVEVFGEHMLCETDAKLCGTISYELLCAVSKRVPRYYYLGGKCVDHNLQLLG